MSLSTDTLQDLRTKIAQEAQIVEAELTDLGFAPDGSVEVHFDEGFADAAHTTSEMAKTLSLAEGLRQRLREARVALERIDKGTYGICESCGNEIPSERLDAVPCTRFCMACKQKAG